MKKIFQRLTDPSKFIFQKGPENSSWEKDHTYLVEKGDLQKNKLTGRFEEAEYTESQSDRNKERREQIDKKIDSFFDANPSMRELTAEETESLFKLNEYTDRKGVEKPIDAHEKRKGINNIEFKNYLQSVHQELADMLIDYKKPIYQTEYLEFVESSEIDEELLKTLEENIAQYWDKAYWNEQDKQGNANVFETNGGVLTIETGGVNKKLYSFPGYNFASQEEKGRIREQLKKATKALNENKDVLYNAARNNLLYHTETHYGIEYQVHRPRTKEELKELYKSDTPNISYWQDPETNEEWQLFSNGFIINTTKKSAPVPSNKFFSQEKIADTPQEKQEPQKSQEKTQESERIEAAKEKFKKANKDFYETELLPASEFYEDLKPIIENFSINEKGGRSVYGGSALILELQKFLGFSGRDLDGLTGEKTKHAFEKWKNSFLKKITPKEIKLQEILATPKTLKKIQEKE